MEQERAAAELGEAIELSRKLGDTNCLARALGQLAVLRLWQGRYDEAAPPAEERLALHLAAGDAQRAVVPRVTLIQAALGRGDIITADRLVVADRAVAGAPHTTATLLGEAFLAEARGDEAEARVLWEAYVRKIGAETGERSPEVVMGLPFVARTALRQGDTGAAVLTCAEALAIHRRIGPTQSLPLLLNVLAQAAERGGLLTFSARLLAAIEVQRREFAVERLGLHADQQATIERVRTALGDMAFAEAWAKGETLSTDAAIEYGLAVVAELQQALGGLAVGAQVQNRG